MANRPFPLVSERSTISCGVGRLPRSTGRRPHHSTGGATAPLPVLLPITAPAMAPSAAPPAALRSTLPVVVQAVVKRLTPARAIRVLYIVLFLVFDPVRPHPDGQRPGRARVPVREPERPGPVGDMTGPERQGVALKAKAHAFRRVAVAEACAPGQSTGADRPAKKPPGNPHGMGAPARSSRVRPGRRVCP